MDITSCLMFRLKQLLSKLKQLDIIRSYTLKIDFGGIREDLKESLEEIDALLQKCVKKIRLKSRRAEIRNIIGELVRKKNTKELKVIRDKSEELGNFEKDKKSEKRFLCEFCGLKFLDFSKLKVHILKIHEQSSTFKSVKNIRVLTSEGGVEGHSNAENISDVIINSNLENDSTENNYQVQSLKNETGVAQEVGRDTLVPRDEFRKNENEPDENYMCQYCDSNRIFHKLESLKKHIRVKHRTSVEHRCGECGKVFSEKGKLNRHILTHQEGQFQCSECCQRFHRKDNLKRHITLHDKSSNAFECKFCKKKFSLKFNRDTHEENVHTNAEVYCEICGKKCKNESTLKAHRKLHEENRISCSLCCMTFTRKSHYQNHVKKKHKGLSPFQKLFDSFAVQGTTSS